MNPTEYQIVLKPIQLINSRIDDLNKSIEKINALIDASSNNPTNKRIYERKKEWLLSLLAINVLVYEQLKNSENNGIH
jgi:hypothetical protein